MKRSWIGLGLLILLLVLGIVASGMMNRIHRAISWELEEAADLAMAGLWQKAEDQAELARAEWEKWSDLRNSLADHAPMEDAEGLFAQLPVFAAEKDLHFAALCRELSRKVRAVGEAHRLSLGDFL